MKTFKQFIEAPEAAVYRSYINAMKKKTKEKNEETEPNSQRPKNT